MNNMKTKKTLHGEFYLKPGELYSGCLPVRVTTVLGSCVSVTMYHQQTNMAVMCHAMQPACSRQSSGCRDDCCEKFKFVRCAIDEMIEKLDRLGVPKEGLEVKLFGGAVQFQKSDEGRGGKAVGMQNIEAALEILSTHDIPPDVVEVGGGMGRKIIFDTNNGAVFLKRIGSNGKKRSPGAYPVENHHNPVLKKCG